MALIAIASPAAAQWTRVTELPATDVFSVRVNGDTITAGSDTAVYVSTNAGVTWKRSARVTAGVTEIRSTWVRNSRIYAGTSRQGVFVSENLGDTWLGYNQGLVGGIFNTQLDIEDLLVRGDNLYAATEGAGVWVRNLAGAGTWSHFGNVFEPNAASTVAGIAASDTRLLACAGGNGMVFFRDPGAPEWTRSFLNNVGFAPGVGAITAAWTGHGWVVGSNSGFFISTNGQEPWTPTGPSIRPMFLVSFALRGRGVYAQIGTGGGTVIAFSGDDGATWEELENMSSVFTYDLAISGSTLYAGRFDGLWRRSIDTVSVPGGSRDGGLRLALAGPQPVGDDVRFRFVLPEAGPVSIDVFDVTGRRAADAVEGSFPAGSNEVSWSARDLQPGVYHAHLTAGGRHATVRLVHIH